MHVLALRLVPLQHTLILQAIAIFSDHFKQSVTAHREFSCPARLA
jgi:hypothetical protein